MTLTNRIERMLDRIEALERLNPKSGNVILAKMNAQQRIVRACKGLLADCLADAGGRKAVGGTSINLTDDEKARRAELLILCANACTQAYDHYRLDKLATRADRCLEKAAELMGAYR